MKNLLTIILFLISLNAFSQPSTIKVIGGGNNAITIDTTDKWTQDVRSNATGDSLAVIKNGVRSAYKYPATSSNGWNTSGNTNPAEPDSSKVLGTLNSTSLRLQTKGVNHVIIDSFGVVHLQDSVRNQLDLQRTGAGGTGNHFYIGNVGDAYVTQNPGDNFRIHNITGVGWIARNITFDEYTGNPSITDKLEHDGSGSEIEVGQDGVSIWTANYATAGTHNLTLISQNGVNGNFGVHVQIPQYTLQVSPNPVAGSPRAGYPNLGIVYNNGVNSHGDIIFGDGSATTSDRWRIVNYSKDNVTIPNTFIIEQGKNIAGTALDVSRFAINDIGSVGIGTSLPAASAKLELTSTTQGFLLPRMTKTQRDAISSPAIGLMIFQTDNTPGLRTYNGSNWMKYTESTD